jgi:hypothetical protein
VLEECTLEQILLRFKRGIRRLDRHGSRDWLNVEFRLIWRAIAHLFVVGLVGKTRRHLRGRRVVVTGIESIVIERIARGFCVSSCVVSRLGGIRLDQSHRSCHDIGDIKLG